jgi:hypothetical protein
MVIIIRLFISFVSLSASTWRHSLHQRGAVGFSGNIESCIARQNTSVFKIGISERKYQPYSNIPFFVSSQITIDSGATDKSELLRH